MEQEDRIGQLKDFAKEMSETMYHMFIEWYLTFHRPMTECEIMAMNMYKMMIWKAKMMAGRRLIQYSQQFRFVG